MGDCHSPFDLALAGSGRWLQLFIAAPPTFLTSCLPQHEILENEISFATDKRRSAGWTRYIAVNGFRSAFDFDDVVKGLLRTGGHSDRRRHVAPQVRGTRNSSNYRASVTERRGGKNKPRSGGMRGWDGKLILGECCRCRRRAGNACEAGRFDFLRRGGNVQVAR
jgi:hypothetical protein